MARLCSLFIIVYFVLLLLFFLFQICVTLCFNFILDKSSEELLFGCYLTACGVFLTFVSGFGRCLLPSFFCTCIVHFSCDFWHYWGYAILFHSQMILSLTRVLSGRRLWSLLLCYWKLEMKLQKRNWSYQEQLKELLISSSSKMLLRLWNRSMNNIGSLVAWKEKEEPKYIIYELYVWVFKFHSYTCRYPFNNALHHQVESIIFSCLESKNTTILDNLLQECNLVSKILEADRSVTISNEPNQVHAL